MGLEGVVRLVLLAQRAVVVDLPVHRQNQRSVLAAQRLRARIHADDRQALVHQDGAFVVVDAGPVRAAVAHPARLLQRLGAQGGGIGLEVEDAEDRAHGGRSEGKGSPILSAAATIVQCRNRRSCSVEARPDCVPAG